MKNSVYLKQAELLLRVLPQIFKENCYALKGGTAINFFVRNFPRLSVDIDLTFLPVKDRLTTLNEINFSLARITENIENSLNQILIVPKKLKETESIIGLSVNSYGVSINIEVNIVFRGSVYPAQVLSVTDTVKSVFSIELEMRSLSIPDIYGGKICAALDRQHPRDLFDIKLLLENEGITEKIRKAFLVYLISHSRPIYELLNPNLQDIKPAFLNEFTGMTDEDVTYEQLLNTRENLVAIIQKDLTGKEKEFLISFKSGDPKWDLLEPYTESDPVFNIARIISLPSVNWKLKNIQKMDKKKHREALGNLENFLNHL